MVGERSPERLRFSAEMAAPSTRTISLRKAALLASWLSASCAQLPTAEEDEMGGSHVTLYSEPRPAEGMPIPAAAEAEGRIG